MYPNQTFKNSFKVSMLGQLFNNITPFSTGGQPMQAYELTKTGKRVSDSLSAMAMKFIITQTALVVSTIIVVTFEFSFFKQLMQNYIWIAIVGFTVNILAIIVVILAGIKKKMITFFTTPIIRLLGKIHIFKEPEETIGKLDKSIDNFKEQFLFMKSSITKLCLLLYYLYGVSCIWKQRYKLFTNHTNSKLFIANHDLHTNTRFRIRSRRGILPVI